MAKPAIEIRCLTDRDVGSIVGLWNGVLESEKEAWWVDDHRIDEDDFGPADSAPYLAGEESFVAESDGSVWRAGRGIPVWRDGKSRSGGPY